MGSISESEEGGAKSFRPPDGRGALETPSEQGLGGDDPQGLWGRPDALPQVRRYDKDRRFHHGSWRGRPHHRSPEVDVHC